MKVTEQIDALEAVAVDSFKFLAVTRILACVLAMPLLTTVTDFCGIVGGFLAETTISGMSWELYFQPRVLADRVQRLHPGDDEDGGVRDDHRHDRAAISASRRRRAPRASAARRRAASSSSSILIIMANVVLVRLIFFLFPASMTHRSSSAPGRSTPHEPAIRLERRDASRSTAARCWTMSRSTCRQAPRFCLLGRSGTGKSVTLKHIIGLHEAGSRAACSSTART